MLEFENNYWHKGMRHIAGIDEAGRGCLFGSVVAAAVILPQGEVIEGVNDSKQLSAKKREALFEIIKDRALSIGIGVVDAATIDRINIKQAARLAMSKAANQLQITPDILLVDAEHIETSYEQLSLIKGDARSQSIAAASIVAKVTRDQMCMHWDLQHPEYGIAIHKGYATKKHREAIQQYGPSALHRHSFLTSILAERCRGTEGAHRE